MFAWPHLELTDYERRFVRYYKTGSYPGVLKRVYKIIINSLAVPDTEFDTAQLTDEIQIARRSRVFGLMFIGNLSAWRLQIQTASGEGFTATEPGSSVSPLVTAMVPGTVYDADAAVGEPPGATRQSQTQYGALIIEPNWELAPNTTLRFTGTLAAALDPTTDIRFLSIGVHVWEFPGMDRSHEREDLS
jgi:hypothetical protein